MCEAGVTNAEPSEDNSISAVKVGRITIAKRGHDRMQLVEFTCIRFTNRQTKDSIMIIANHTACGTMD